MFLKIDFVQDSFKTEKRTTSRAFGAWMGSATAAPEAAAVAVARRPAATGDAVKSLLEWKLVTSAQGRRRDDDDASEHHPSKHSTSTSASSSATVAAARCAVEAYARLPPRGKPNQGEHTVMASFVVEEEEQLPSKVSLPSPSSPPLPRQPNNSSAFTAVAVATGSKCVGAAARSRRGDVVNDCHAEVLARRALLRWMVAEMEKAKAEGGEGDGGRGAAAGSRFFERDNSCSSSSPPSSSSSSALPRFRKKTPWRLHLVTSQVPCGDACVRPGAVTGARAMMTGGRRAGGAGGGEEGEDKEKILRPSPPPPEGLIDVRDQRPGIARRKPGRGDSTLSMSCSDKIAKWGCLGVQGSLLSRVLAVSSGDREEKGEGGAIFIDEVTVVVAAATEEENEGERDEDAGQQTVLALRRALADRTRPLRGCLEGPFRWSPPQRFSVVSVAWKKDEEMEARRDESHPSAASSHNPLDDLGLDTSAGGSATAAEEKDQKKAKNFPSSSRRTPSGLALAWSAVRERNGSGNYERAEVLLGGYGCLAGFNRKAEKKRKKEEDGEEAGAKDEEEERRRKIHHRPPLPQLSKRAALERFFELVGCAEGISGSRSMTYREAKEGAVAYRRSWQRMLGFQEEEAAAAEAAATTGVAASRLSSPPPPPLQGWLSKPRELEEFTLLSG